MKLCNLIPAYTEELRLSNALNMIRGGCTSINAIALKNGYKNAGYFSKCFKGKYGINPSELIKND
ncbi:MAG: helix-turn-helix domain-containing protein [Clostridiaceae bacterium]|jgi:two-component system response regulator YesN|nr:helix-turn-helix domain-containing protein [Clostridiaceae bacterium]